MGVDTNVWIYLAKGHFPHILNNLEKLVLSNDLIILTNEIIINEWKRNKNNIKRDVERSIRNEAGAAIKLSSYITDKNEKKVFDSILSKYRGSEEYRLESAEKLIEKVDFFISDKCVFNEVTNETKLKAIELSLNKLAPIHKNKNSLPDAIILLDFISRMESTRDIGIASEFFFVSNNSEEFSLSKTKRDELHPDINSHLNFDLKYFNNIAKALNMADDLVRSYYWYYSEEQENED